MAVRNIRTSQGRQEARRLQKTESASPLGSSSVSRGRTRFIGQRSLVVEGSQVVSGQLYVDGLEEVSGQLRVTGSLVVGGNADITGPMTVRGPLTVRGETTFIGPLTIEGETAIVGPLTIEGQLDVTGPITVTGPMTITGELEVTGKTTITGDLDVTGKTKFTGDLEIAGDTQVTGDLEVAGDGKIRVNRITLNPKGGELGNGSIDVSSGLNINSVAVTFSERVRVVGGFSAEGGVLIPNTATTTKPPNVYMDPTSGRLLRSV